MRPGKLYIKILLSFLAVLFTTLLVVFALFVVRPTKHATSGLEEYAKTRALKVQALIADKIRSAPDTALENNEPLKTFISDLGEILGARVWLAEQEGAVLLQSFPGKIPERAARLVNQGGVNPGPISLYRQRGLLFYAVIPMAFPAGEKGNLHVLFDRPEGPFHSGKGLTLGLMIIGLMAA